MHRKLALAVVAVSLTGAFAWACSDDKSSSSGDNSSGSNGDVPDGSGSSSSSSGEPSSSSGDTTTLTAKATLGPTTDAGTVQGTAEFVEQGSVTKVNVQISSGGAAGDHGLHIHDKGSCAATDAGPGNGAGGHWNPLDASHGFPGGDVHHLGDLGNITIDDAGKGSLSLTFPSTYFHVHDGPRSVVGHSVIYHAGTDDGRSQPTGDAGGRPGCGVIEKQ